MSPGRRPFLIIMTPQDMSRALDEFLPEVPDASRIALKDSDELDAFSAEPDPLDAFDREIDVAAAPAVPLPQTMPTAFLGANWQIVAAAVITLGFLDASGDRTLFTSHFSEPGDTSVVGPGPDSAYLDIRTLLATIGASPAIGSTGEDAPVTALPARTVEKPTPPPPEKTSSGMTAARPSSRASAQPSSPAPRANADSRPAQSPRPRAVVVPPSPPTPELVVRATPPAVATAGFGQLSLAIPAASIRPEPPRAASSAATATAAAAPEVTVAAVAAVAKPEPPSELNSIGVVLGEYRRAFGYLNSAIAAAVWPTVDRRALDRAFSQLSEQEFTFSSCEVSVQGALASAACTGHARFVPKVGNTTPRSEPRRWDFRLRKSGDGWVIDGVNAR